MEVGTTEMAIFGIAIGGAYKALELAFGIIKLLITRNGKKQEDCDEPMSTQAMLEKYLKESLDKKTNKEICDERHKNIEHSLEDGSKKMTNLQNDMVEVKTTTANILHLIKGSD